MKKILLYSFTILCMLAGCRKSDNPLLPELQRVPIPKLSIDASADASISAQNPDDFLGKFIVDLRYPDETKPAKFDVVVIKNGNKANSKLLQANVNTFPTALTITGAQIKSLFGSSSVLGDAYQIGVDITTQDGKVYPAFPLVGVGTNNGISSIANSTPTITFAALCSFNMSDFGAIGSTVPYTVLEDGWGDYPPGETISVTIIDETHLSFSYPTDVSSMPIIITINPANNTTSAAKQAFGGYSSLPSYGIFFAASTGVANNVVLPCDLTVKVELAFSTATLNFVPGVISLKKK